MPVGVYALDTRIQLVRRARHSLDLQYYLIQNDDTGRLLLRKGAKGMQGGERGRGPSDASGQ